ncbi:MAG: hypothetical protein ACRCTJ_03705, partial [Brevinema sp.]
IFFSKGYLPRYRPVRPGSMSTTYQDLLLVDKTIIRVSLLKELLTKNQLVIDDLKKAAHSPYVFIHQDIAHDDKEWKLFLHRTERAMGIKKNAKNIYLFCLLIALGVFKSPWYIMPLILLEMSVYFWFIFSLGIRQGIRMIYFFIINRFE